jgi:hypothetical protein
MASTSITPTAAGVATVTATLAPGVYNPSQSIAGTLFATSSGLAIGVTTPYLYIAQGATVSVPITARVVNAGAPQNGTTVDFIVVQGSGALSSGSAVTNSSGYASVTLTLTNFTTNIQLTACVGQGPPCETIYGNAVAPALFNLQAVSGAGQIVAGTTFQPLVVRVTDFATPPDPILGATVLFQSTVMRPAGNNPILTTQGDPTNTQNDMPILLGISQTSVQSGAGALASIVPSVDPFTGILEVAIQVSAGTSAALQDVMESLPQSDGNTSSATIKAPWRGSVPVLERPIVGRNLLLP